MSRERKSDFESLKEYVSDYSLNPLLDSDDYLELLSSNHKKYYAILVLQAELLHHDISIDKQVLSMQNNVDQLFTRHFNELVSDLSSYLFCWINGSYKASYCVLRRSIESFLYLACIPYDNEVIGLENVTDLFDTVKMTNLYTSDFNREMIDKLSHKYSQLCSYVHLDADTHIDEVSSLRHFPSYSHDQALRARNIFKELVEIYLYLILFFISDCFYEFHYKNRTVLLESLNTKKTNMFHIVIVNNSRIESSDMFYPET